ASITLRPEAGTGPSSSPSHTACTAANNDCMSRTRSRGRYVAMAAAALIVAATLTPRPSQAEFVALTPPWCLICGDLGTVDMLLNLALFVPLGIGLRMAGWRSASVAAG